MSFQSMLNSPLWHFSKLNFTSVNIITSNVMSLDKKKKNKFFLKNIFKLKKIHKNQQNLKYKKKKKDVYRVK